MTVADGMTPALWALVAALVLVMVQLGLQSIAVLRQHGAVWVLSPRDEVRETTGLGGRLVRAHRNLLEILPQFAAAVLLVHVAGLNGSYANVGAWAFVGARIFYVPAYLFGPPGLRPACWMAGQIAILVILWDLVA